MSVGIELTHELKAGGRMTDGFYVVHEESATALATAATICGEPVKVLVNAGDETLLCQVSSVHSDSQTIIYEVLDAGDRAQMGS